MAFIHGKGTDIYINGWDVNSYLQSVEIPGTCDVAETTTLDKSSKTYIAGNKDATVTLEGLYDGEDDAIDEIVENILGSTGNEICQYFGGDTAGNRGVGTSVIETEYNITTNVDDTASITVSGQSNVGRESLISLMALSTVTSSGSTTEQDYGEQTTNGGSAYLHCTAVTGTVSVKIEDSSDNITYNDLVSFSNVDTANSSQRVTFSGNVERYTRVTYTLDGGEAITMQVGIHRN